MADINYRDLFWQVRAELPGVPEPLLFFNYAEAVREFCRKTKAWQYSIADPLDLDADTAWPTLTPGVEIPASTYVVEPVRLKWDSGEIIRFKTRDQLDDIDGDWEQATATQPDYWTITEPGQFRVYPLLSANTTAQLYMRVALAPTLTVSSPRTGMPEEIVNEWSEAWSYGALSRLMKIPGKDWTNIRLAANYGEMFAAAAKEAKSRAAADYGRPRRAVAYGGLPIGGVGTRISNDDYGQ